MRVVRPRSDAITDRGRTEKNAQCIGCQLLEGKAREASICRQLLSTAKGGSSTEGCGTVYPSRIPQKLCGIRDLPSAIIQPRRNRNSSIERESNDISDLKDCRFSLASSFRSVE